MKITQLIRTKWHRWRQRMALDAAYARRDAIEAAMLNLDRARKQKTQQINGLQTELAEARREINARYLASGLSVPLAARLLEIEEKKLAAICGDDLNAAEVQALGEWPVVAIKPSTPWPRRGTP